MKFYKKILGILLAMVMIFSMAACGGDSNTSADATETVKAAQAKIQEVTNLESEKVVDVDISMGGQSLDVKTISNITFFTDPMKLKIAMTIDMGEAFGGPQTSEIYADEVDDNTTLYMNVMGVWYKQAILSNQLMQYDTQQGVVTYLDSTTGLKKAGTEQVNGANATKYDGIITGQKMKEAVETTGALDNLESMLAGMNIDANSLYDGLSDITISVWVDEEGYPVKCEMNMTAMAQDLMNKIMQASGETAEEGISVTNMILSITNKNFNTATDFDIPEEAKNASEINV